METLVALYKNMSDAQDVVTSLVNEKFPRESIGLVANERKTISSRGDKNLVPLFTESGVPEDHAILFSEGVRRGGAVLIMTCPEDAQKAKAEKIFDKHKPVFIDATEKRWRGEGWSGYDANAAPMSDEERARESKALANEIEVVDEEVTVGKRAIEKGQVRVRSFVTERPISKDLTLREEEVRIERTPVNKSLSPAEADRAFQEKSISVTEHAEMPVVEKSARVVEKVKVGVEVSEHKETVTATERHQNVEVDRGDSEPAKRR